MELLAGGRIIGPFCFGASLVASVVMEAGPLLAEPFITLAILILLLANDFDFGGMVIDLLSLVVEAEVRPERKLDPASRVLGSEADDFL